MRPRYLVLLLLVVLAASVPWAASAGEITSTGAEMCVECHEDQVAAFATNPHSALDTEGLASLASADGSCTACHGDATNHFEEMGGEGTIFAFADSESGMARSEKCLTCHADTHPRFESSSHARAGMDCGSCHSMHAESEIGYLLQGSDEFGSALVNRGTSASCQECHADVFTQFEFNERHRLQEGTLECSSCHDPHAPQARALLGGFKQEQCASCHVDKGGPFVFEHGSVRVEGCTSCHTPHGSPNRHMLTIQNTAEVCYTCHALVPGFHSRFVAGSQCTSCHSAIHGSNFSPFFLR